MRKQELEKWDEQQLLSYKNTLQHRIAQLRTMTLVCERENINLQGQLNQLKSEAAKHNSNTRFYENYIEPSKRAVVERLKKLPPIPSVPMPTLPALPSKETISANVDSLKQNLADKGARLKESLWGVGGFLQQKIWGKEQPPLQERQELELPEQSKKRPGK